MTEDNLSALLAAIGFITEPVRSSLKELLRLASDENHWLPCRYIGSTKNGLGSPVIVTIRGNKHEVYFYEDVNFTFHLWEQLGESAPEALLRETILQASSAEAISRRYPTFR